MPEQPDSGDLAQDLRALVNCHSTPGDEDEVAAYLTRSWQTAGWRVGSHGRYAVSARPAGEVRGDRPTVLVCAHMDSPGFVVQSVSERRCGVIALGQPRLSSSSAEVVLKTHRGQMTQTASTGGAPDTNTDKSWILLQKERSESAPTPFWIPRPPHVTAGDRLCFHGAMTLGSDGTITSPFLDNRLGCSALCELARRWARHAPSLNVVLGATAGEEMGSIGAPVLAAAIEPDLVICLDATYEDDDQAVVVGGGPVLTLNDASVNLGYHQRDRALAFAKASGLPLQTEVYNVSGTDSRVFPAIGLPAPVYALLLPTRGNHTAAETGHLDDLANLLALIDAIAQENAWEEFFMQEFIAH